MRNYIEKKNGKKGERMKQDNDVSRVLKEDGVSKVILKEFENFSTVKLGAIKRALPDGSWAVRVVYNKIFGGVLIKQLPGEGNRLHYHPDADECWIILEGKWEWFIEGEGIKKVSRNDIVVVRQGTKHKITCIGKKPGIRLAITKPDVNHVYVGGKR